MKGIEFFPIALGFLPIVLQLQLDWVPDGHIALHQTDGKLYHLEGITNQHKEILLETTHVVGFLHDGQRV